MKESSKAGLVIVFALTAISLFLKVQTCKNREKLQRARVNQMINHNNSFDPSLISNNVDHCANPENAPERKDIKWDEPQDSLTEIEKAVTGTWTASVGDMSLKTGGVLISMGDTAMATAHTKVAYLLDNLKKNKYLKSECIWLELYDDHTGFWNACMLNNNSPNALDNVDPFTGEHTGFGVKFNWKMGKSELHIAFEDCLKYPMIVGDSSVVTVRVKYWDLKITKTGVDAEGYQTFAVSDYFPEYNYTSPVKYTYQIINKTLSGKITKYKSAIME